MHSEVTAQIFKLAMNSKL